MDSNYVKEQKSKKSQYTHEEETGWSASQTETQTNYEAVIKTM